MSPSYKGWLSKANNDLKGKINLGKEIDRDERRD